MTPSFSDEPIKREKKLQVARTVIVIVPFGVVGSGKSTIEKNLKAMLMEKDSADWTFDSISSDQIRSDLMAPLIERGQTKD